ncbi:putative beta-glucosidase [Rosa chinensis]|uniref:Putative beta-glucosidase n=1 Tax=Rosa chinensis TaxID=74649 RepID=A0A2P6QCR8_ROSCH|nr:putative beta-glucosidase [Rosa chinensis]
MVDIGLEAYRFSISWSRLIPNTKDFTAYANVCFEQFGDRVGHWTTMNEPNVFVLGGYDIGFLPPQRCSAPFGFNCSRVSDNILGYGRAVGIYQTTLGNPPLYIHENGIY